MGWQKIVFTLDQIDEYERLYNQINDLTLRDPDKYKHVAIFNPTLAFREKYDSEFTRTKYFSPDTVKYFSALLQPYGPVSCERPPSSEVSGTLTMGIDDEFLFRE